MGKILFFLLVAAVIYLLLRSRGAASRAGARVATQAEDMVACAHCGLNVPRSEAVQWRGLAFCSEEHRMLGPG